MEKFLNENFISLFLIKLRLSPTKAPVTCPITVATAAPFTSSLGNPKSPNIKIGSKIILIIAPTPWVIMV